MTPPPTPETPGTLSFDQWRDRVQSCEQISVLFCPVVGQLQTQHDRAWTRPLTGLNRGRNPFANLYVAAEQLLAPDVLSSTHRDHILSHFLPTERRAEFLAGRLVGLIRENGCPLETQFASWNGAFRCHKSLSLGLWWPQSDRTWSREINIRADFDPKGVADADFASLESLLTSYIEHMGQDSMYLVTTDAHAVGSRDESWQVEHRPGGLIFTPVGTTNRWRVPGGLPANSPRELLQRLMTNLDHHSIDDRTNMVAEYVREQHANTPVGLGATFEFIGSELVIQNAGGAGFLFAPSLCHLANFCPAHGLDRLFSAAINTFVDMHDIDSSEKWLLKGYAWPGRAGDRHLSVESRQAAHDCWPCPITHLLPGQDPILGLAHD